MSNSAPETYSQKLERYRVQNQGRPLTTKQLARLGAPPPPAPVPDPDGTLVMAPDGNYYPADAVQPLASGAPLLDQAAEQPTVTPQLDSDPTVITVDGLLDFIANNADPLWRGQTFRIDSDASDDFTVRQNLVSVRNRISHAVRRAGLQYSTQMLYDDQGQIYLAVYLSL